MTGDDFEIASRVFGVTEQGNFEGSNVLYRARSHAEVAEAMGIDVGSVDTAVDRALERLAAFRADRVPPSLDDKVIASWNGLAIRALAEAGAVLGNDEHLDDARACARFVLERLVDGDGRLLRSWARDRATTSAFLED